jgi:hypothetical protein
VWSNEIRSQIPLVSCVNGEVFLIMRILSIAGLLPLLLPQVHL